ncbi:hypothetical protein FA524_04215 [Pseudomonas aeruginosa]|jgi:hypothetical protein|nr:hypothetical protein F3G48_31495 [Pseudomonas aeruginosa]MDV6662212.1 hypothetical protein [Pseudomonas aeruginosa]MDV6733885.1 hypothetical protein [Pseudomonas aeruginosa]MDV6855652.1 hypothetical protein [Pseudomonas aeruginosa]OXU04063.1 hypothetical protein CF337_12065 [Pseudomonas aeruginosa]
MRPYQGITKFLYGICTGAFAQKIRVEKVNLSPFNVVSREDCGQQRAHGSLGCGSDGRAAPHEHKIEYNERAM